MILTDELIKLYIDSPLSSHELRVAREFTVKHQLHVLGKHFDIALEQLKGVESDNQQVIKEEVARPTTIGIYSGVINQYKKVFKATGGSKDYFLENEELVADFEKFLSNIKNDVSIQEIMQKRWCKGMFEDFNGVFSVELPKLTDEELQRQEEGEAVEPFIKFWTLDFIHDILVKGDKVQYIIFRWEGEYNEKPATIYRVIDDATDQIWVEQDGHIFPREIEGERDFMDNPWGYVPVIQLSQVNFNADNDTLKKSFISDTMPNADNYLDISIGHSVSIKLHQHPKMVMYDVECDTCNGSGESRHIDTEKNDYFLAKCETCYGTGKVKWHETDTSQGISVPLPEEGEIPAVPEVIKYISIDNETLEQQIKEMEREEAKIEKGALGVTGVLNRPTRQQTATEMVLNRQPLRDRLDDFKTNGEKVEKFLTDTMGRARYGERYITSRILWGSTPILKTEQELDKEYAEAKKNGFPDSVLANLLRERNAVKFDNNPRRKERANLLLDLEPFETYTVKELVDAGIARREDIVLKQYFTDIVEEFEKRITKIDEFQPTAMNRDELIRTELRSIAKEFEEKEEQVSSAEIASMVIEFQKNISAGIMTPESASMAMMAAFNLTEEKANQLFI